MSNSGVSLPIDVNGSPLGAVAIIATTNLASVTASSAATLLPGSLGEGLVYRFMCTQDCYLAFGTASVVASSTDQLETYGGGFGKVPSGATHYAVIRESTDGITSMSEVG